MAYDIRIYEEDIVFIRFHGQSDLEENEMAREKVMQTCCDSCIRLILADWREAKAAATVSTKDLYEFGSTWPNAPTSPPYWLATVQARDVNTHLDIEFSDTVAHNRGLLVSKIFTEVEEAINWLRSIKHPDRRASAQYAD